MPALSPSLSWISASVTAGALLVSGCVGITSPGASSHVDLESPALRQFAVANMTDMERDVRIETGTRKNEKLTPTLFWTGIGAGTVGAIGGIAFGVAGFVTKNQLNDAYYDGSGLTVDEQERLIKNGDTYNTLAITFTALAVVGYALAIVTYGVDWNRCGPLAEKKRRCKELGLGAYAAK
jgi:hypothetical protein